MQTIKTALVVVVLLGVLYGAYSFLTTPEATPPPEVAEHLGDFDDEFKLDIDMGNESQGGPQAIPDTSYSPAAGNPARPGNFVQSEGGSSTIPSPDGFESTDPKGPPKAPGYGDYKPDSSAGMKSPSSANPPAPGGQTPSAKSSAPPKPGVLADNKSQSPKDSRSKFDREMEKKGYKLQYNPAVTENAAKSTSAKAGAATQSTGKASVTMFDRAKRTAESLEGDGDLRKALAELSIFYNSPDLSGPEHGKLLQRLDRLAGRVIYSREHHLGKPYEVRRHDKLSTIAKTHRVPTRLLQNINGVENPDVLVAGTKLKIVPGPFRAEVDLQRKELTLFVDNLYAGRFAISIGQDPAPVPGEFTVHNKEMNKQYLPTRGAPVRGGDPRNPFGHHWLDLGSQLSIHGSATNATADDSGFGCISLSPIDARDVYGILLVGSKVKILR